MKEFDKIIGYSNVKRELIRVCDILKNGDKYAKLGVKIPGGILLHGKPGLGKTTMAKCFIEASGRKVFVCRKIKPNGEFVKEIKSIFDEAANSAPSIVFLDDMDKYANDDDKHVNSEEYVALQSCIDEIKDKDVFVIATANDLDNLPDSLLRVGRFDKTIKINNPKGKDAEDIIRYYLSTKSYVDDVDVEEIAHLMDGRSCAELETAINEAGIYAGFAGKEKIESGDIISACLRLVFNSPENLDDISDEALQRIAYHEAGHAVVAEILEPGSISIITACTHSGEKDGSVAYNQAKDYFTSKKYMENRVMCLLAGRAATELIYNEVDVGAISDLRRAFDIVQRFVDNYCSYSFEHWNFWYRGYNDSSEATKSRTEMQIYADMQRFYDKAKNILFDNREFLDQLAATIMDKKIVLGKEVRAIKSTCTLAA